MGKGHFSILPENSKIHNRLFFKEMRKNRAPRKRRYPVKIRGILTGYFLRGACYPPQNSAIFLRGFRKPHFSGKYSVKTPREYPVKIPKHLFV
jgi:hypothetical protein